MRGIREADQHGQCRCCMRRRETYSISRSGGGTYRRGGRQYRSSICGECATMLAAGRWRPKYAGESSQRYGMSTLIEIAVAYSATTGVCYFDTDGDGGCPMFLCPVCHPGAYERACCTYTYTCPGTGSSECTVHGGFDVCCDHPECPGNPEAAKNVVPPYKRTRLIE